MHVSPKTLDFEMMTPRTREVLQRRIEQAPVTEPRFFSHDEFTRLLALAEVALPQKGETVFVDLAGDIDTRFAESAPGKGWRYNDLPPEPQAYREVLAALASSDIETLLRLRSPSWIEHFWEDFLADITETYYAHPLVQASIGAFGMIDGRA